MNLQVETPTLVHSLLDSQLLASLGAVRTPSFKVSSLRGQVGTNKMEAMALVEKVSARLGAAVKASVERVLKEQGADTTDRSVSISHDLFNDKVIIGVTLGGVRPVGVRDEATTSD